MNSTPNKNMIFVSVGILLLLIGLGLGGMDVYRLTNYDRVESMLTVTYRQHSGKKAHVSYEYQGTRYEDKVLSSYNAFTMKDGKAYDLLINPASPEHPQTTSFALDVLFLVMGGVAVYAGTRKE